MSGATEVSPLDALRRVLRERDILLVLDNFEQVTTAGPGLVELLQHCSRAKAMVTSREALRVGGERLFPVSPLALPARSSAEPTVDAVLESEAGRLFCERAEAVGSGFVLTAQNAADVAAICRRLDGLPLALELAAAQVKLFSVDRAARAAGGSTRRAEGRSARPARLDSRRCATRSSGATRCSPMKSEECSGHFSVFTDARLGDVEKTFCRCRRSATSTSSRR